MDLDSGNSRNKMLLSNILGSGVLKAIGLVTSLLTVPVTLHYLDKESYGIWMTISSMAFWIFTFDIGLGNGMRNYLTMAISRDDKKAAQTYVSSTFVMITVLALLIGAVAAPLIMTLDFNRLLNTESIVNDELQIIILVALVLTLANFVVKNIGFIYVALQKYALNDLLAVGGSVVALGIVYLLTLTTEGNLLYVVTTLMAVPVAVFMIGGIPVFTRYTYLRPSLHHFDRQFGKTVISKGMGFFAIQITSCLCIFGSSNLFISHFFGPEAVTVYNIAYKYFNLLAIGYTIIIAPMWNAYTDASVKGDWAWINKTFKRALLMWGITVAAGAVMLWLADWCYAIWVGQEIKIPLSVSASVLTFICLFNLNNCVTYLLNGLNTIRVQIITSATATTAYILLVSIKGRDWGVEGIALSMSVCYAAMGLVHLYQCRLILQRKATGLWSR